MIARKVFVPLLQQGGNEPLRVWVLGCSTGQEPYSLAMLYAECAEKFPHARKLQVFATDLNEANLTKARNGFYAKSIMQDVSAERLRRFFVEEEGGYRVIKPLREQVVFARQNVISDPPFSRMDLISCRNLMIYLEPSLQKKMLPTFHYALKPDGFLFLGASESIGGFTDLFEPVGKKHKIFSKKAAPTGAFQLPVHSDRARPPGNGPMPRAPSRVAKSPVGPAGGASGRAQRGARGGPRDGQPVCPARGAHQCRPANPAVSRFDRRLPGTVHRQGEFRFAENGARRPDAAAAGRDQQREEGRQDHAQGECAVSAERQDAHRACGGRAAEKFEGALLPRLV